MEWIPSRDNPEYILCAAIWIVENEQVVHQPKYGKEYGFAICGRRHHNCFASLRATGYTKDKSTIIDQGFLTSKDRFVDRKEAGKIAFECGQIKEETDCLFSEDLY